VEPLQAALDGFARSYVALEQRQAADKLGLTELRAEDDTLHAQLRSLMERAQVDMTLFYRALMDFDPAQPAPTAAMEEAFYEPALREQFDLELRDWLMHYAQRLASDESPVAQRRERMRLVNPRYVLRNYLAQEAIDLATSGDLSGVQALQEVMRHPYDDQPGRERFAAKRPAWAKQKAGCSMLSCSS
jgi:uncharacterized protein YdiU (UPF0061 family)